MNVIWGVDAMTIQQSSSHSNVMHENLKISVPFISFLFPGEVDKTVTFNGDKPAFSPF